MKITFISVGKIKKSFCAEGVAEYVKRIKRYAPVEVVEVKEEPSPASTPKDVVLRQEGERILKRLKKGDHVVVLAEDGKKLGSRALAQLVSGLQEQGAGRVCFIVGGAWGLHESVKAAASTVLSLSSMTLPHDLARLVLAEQVYRAFTIMRGEPYSH